MRDYGVTKLYRIARKCYENNIPLLPKIIKLFIRLFYSATIPYKCQIGYGTKFPHGGQGVVINEKAVIGDNCIISVGAVIGGKSGTHAVPIIGNNVTIGANSCIIGAIKIGDNAVIGAGSVVVKNVEKNTIVAGNPAKEIKEKVKRSSELVERRKNS